MPKSWAAKPCPSAPVARLLLAVAIKSVCRAHLHVAAGVGGKISLNFLHALALPSLKGNRRKSQAHSDPKSWGKNIVMCLQKFCASSAHMMHRITQLFHSTVSSSVLMPMALMNKWGWQSSMLVSFLSLFLTKSDQNFFNPMTAALILGLKVLHWNC